MKKTISLVLILVLGLVTKVANADFIFGEPVNFGSPPNSSRAELTPSVSSDEREIYFWSNQIGGFGSWDLWVSTRTSTEEAWLPATNLGAKVNRSGIEGMPCISADGLELYFARGSEAIAELMVARRTARTGPWSTPENLGSVVNSSIRDDTPKLTSDGLELYFVSNRSGGRGQADIWVASRPTTTDAWRKPVNLSIVNSSGYDQWVNLSGDGLVLLFQSTRPGSEYGGLYLSRRKSKDDVWTAPVYLGLPMNGSVYSLLSSVSSDGTMLYLSDHINYAPRAGGAGSADMWQLPVIPIVDFNGDGVVNINDLLRLIESWSQNDPAVDIGPTPFGDGTIGTADLEVLMSYWGQQVDDPTLVAHWALDEAEGNIAVDSMSESGFSNGFVFGDPVWQPTGGQVNGAIELDGMDDFIVTSSVMNPTEESFSVFTWVKGGASGQVVLSQIGGANWLYADPLEGNLMTELKYPGRSAVPLQSQTNITDGEWHRIGLVWDGSNRTLYVDDSVVAEDTQNGLEGSDSGLYIGCGKAMEPGTFFSGLIDDVRIYNRAITP